MGKRSDFLNRESIRGGKCNLNKVIGETVPLKLIGKWLEFRAPFVVGRYSCRGKSHDNKDYRMDGSFYGFHIISHLNGVSCQIGHKILDCLILVVVKPTLIKAIDDN